MPLSKTLEREKEMFDDKFGIGTKYMETSQTIDTKDFLVSSHRRVMEELLEGIEVKYGKKGTFTGSLGYQGIVQGIKSFETETDRVRDEIINLIKQIYE